MSCSYVKVYYGPCESFHTVSHKPQKLRGLRDRLQKRGFRVDFIPVYYMNYCMFEMCGHEIFRCNIKNLHFNSPYDLDPVCHRAIAAIEESSVKFKRARTYLWCWTYIDNEIFRRGQYAPEVHWPKPVHIENFASCLECIKCCGILCAKKEDNDLE